MRVNKNSLQTSTAQERIYGVSLSLAIKLVKQWAPGISVGGGKDSSQRGSLSIGKRVHFVLTTSHTTLQDETEAQAGMG